MNGQLIWYEYDTTSGNDTLPPTEFHVGACWIDWYQGNRALVWIDNCQVADYGPSINIDENKLKNNKPVFLPTFYSKRQHLQNLIEKDATFIIYDAPGRKVKKNLNSGIYIIKIDSKNFKILKKVIYLK